MGCNQHNIREFLIKFWEGRTTLEEEKMIHDFFAYSEVPDDLLNDANYFNLIKQEKSLELGEEFDQEVLSLLGDAPVSSSNSHFFQSYLFKIAASVILIAGIGWWLINTSDTPIADNSHPTEIQKTLSEKESLEVRRAYQETKSALFMISNTMNKAKKHTRKLDKINKYEKK